MHVITAPIALAKSEGSGEYVQTPKPSMPICTLVVQTNNSPLATLFLSACALFRDIYAKWIALKCVLAHLLLEFGFL